MLDSYLPGGVLIVALSINGMLFRVLSLTTVPSALVKKGLSFCGQTNECPSLIRFPTDKSSGQSGETQGVMLVSIPFMCMCACSCTVIRPPAVENFLGYSDLRVLIPLSFVVCFPIKSSLALVSTSQMISWERDGMRLLSVAPVCHCTFSAKLLASLSRLCIPSSCSCL